jgi:hypothetical protein
MKGMGLIKFHQMKNGAMGGGCRRFIVVKGYSKDRFEKKCTDTKLQIT